MEDRQNSSLLPYPECSAHCPRCGSDLYTLESGCECKNPACGWSCDKCKASDQP